MGGTSPSDGAAQGSEGFQMERGVNAGDEDRCPGGRVVITRPDGALNVFIPPVGWSGDSLALVFFAIVWNCTTFTLILAEYTWQLLGFLGPFIAAGLWVIWLALRSLALETRVVIGREEYRVEYRVLERTVQTRGGHTRDIMDVRVAQSVTRHENNTYSTSTWCEIASATGLIQVGSHLTPYELHWLSEEIRASLGRFPPIKMQLEPPLRGAPVPPLAQRAPIPDSWVASPSPSQDQQRQH